MADSLQPPPLTLDTKDDDDDNEDLFVSAIETQNSRKKSMEDEDTTLKSQTSAMDDLNGSVEEIDLNADDEPEPVNLTNGDGKQTSLFDSPEEEEVKPPLEPLREAAVQSPPPRPTEAKPVPVARTEKSPLATESTAKTEDDKFIEIVVEEPKKVGEGMKSFVSYRVFTKTSYPYFRKTEFAVNRRFSDFCGLHDKLSEKHLPVGRIIPPAPEKDAMASAKLKYNKDESLTNDDFIERRRASLERYLNRTAKHPVLRADPDFREFLELDTELPKATNTSALSGAGVKRLFNRMGDTMSKMTFRMDENDTWFEEKQQQVENLDQQLRKLHASVEALLHHRRELTTTTGAFAKSAAMLGNCEEHTSLSCALSQLAETEEKVEQLYGEQANNDFIYLSELIRDYVALIGSVKEVFHQRVKVYQNWVNAQQMLTRKREAKAKLELAGRSDKVPAAAAEVSEWEVKVNKGQEDFENISKTIKQELELFEINRINDFKDNIIKYMESLLETQQQLIKYWEVFLPEAKAIA
ncbi:Sorting nexin-2 [Halotydeus destructor]|nr:Sorting nexin-2 [Halotydeus destructor]